MALNSKKDKRIAAIVLTVLFVFLIYLTKIFVPNWSYSFIENKSGVATIEKLEKLKPKDKQVITYSYYNEYLGNEIKNTRTFSDHHYFEKFKEGETKQMQYAKYFPSFVKFKDIDTEPISVLMIFAYLLVLMAIYFYIRVLQDKTSLTSLVGAKEGKEE